MSGVSQPPGMITCVKQKKLDEEGVRVIEERGLELVMRRLGWGLGGMGSSVRCLSGLLGLVDGLFYACVRSSLSLCVPVSICPIHTRPDIEG